MRRLSALLLLLAVPTCVPKSDPDQGRYSCASDADCGGGYQCRAQFAGGGRCFKVGDCVDQEACDGRDDTCDGRVDETFPDAGAACDTGLKGVCRDGALACVDGGVACAQTVFPSTERCNGLDDDCNGQVDETFDLTSDDAHCGACDVACATGAACAASRCIEVNCADGVDNDGNGRTDCEDDACLGQACDSNLPPSTCGDLVLPVPDAGGDGGLDGGGPADAGSADGGADAGTDGGAPDAGAADGGADAGTDGGAPDGGLLRGCFPPETACDNGYDDDGDGLVDCADPDCDGRTCFSGTLCSMGLCPGPG